MDVGAGEAGPETQWAGRDAGRCGGDAGPNVLLGVCGSVAAGTPARLH